MAGPFAPIAYADGVSRRLARLITSAVAGMAILATAGLIYSCVMLGVERADRVSESARDGDVAGEIKAVSLLQKQIELDAVQVQQFLTDVSATRGLNGLNDGWTEAEKNAQAFQADVATLRGKAVKLGAADMVTALDALAHDFPDYYAQGKTMAQAYVASGPEAGNAMMPAFDAGAERIARNIQATKAAVDQVIARDDVLDKQTEASATRKYMITFGLSVAFALASLAAAGVLIFMVRVRLFGPLGRATEALRALAAGDSSRTLDGADRRDEVGDLARAFAVFHRATLDKLSADAEMQAQRDAVDEERRSADALRETHEREQRTAVEAIASALASLADGDLTYRMQAVMPPAYVKLQDDFNGSIGRLQEAMKDIVQNAEDMLAGTGEISQAADDLSRRTEQQAATLEQTAAALDEITATVKRTADGAGQANAAMDAARADAERSGVVVKDAVQAMTGIEKSAGEISQIIGVIDEIAFQTNLLALNAGVEAARAGDAGKGFAVVASEVRALAQRSAEAAKEIKALISASANQVKQGVDLVGQTGETLSRIVGHVEQITTLVTEISTSSKEQSIGLSQVNTAVNHMDQSTQQNAAMVEQSTAASHSLADEARRLAGLVARFRIGETVGRPKAAKRPGPVPARPGVHAPRPSPVAAAQQRAAAFASAAPATDWEEF